MSSSTTQQHEPAIGKIPTDAPVQVRLNKALETMIFYNAQRFGWPAGTTAEQQAAATPEQQEAANKRGYAVFTDLMVKMCDLCHDDDLYDLAVKKLKAL